MFPSFRAYARSRYRISWTHVNRCVNKVFFFFRAIRIDGMYFDSIERKGKTIELISIVRMGMANFVIGRFLLLALIKETQLIHSRPTCGRFIRLEIRKKRNGTSNYERVSHLQPATL